MADYSVFGMAVWMGRDREALTELDLTVEVYPCPKGPSRHREVVKRSGGREQFPFLIDTNNGISMHESGDIVKYLFERYGGGRSPSTGLLERTTEQAWVPRHDVVLLSPSLEFILHNWRRAHNSNHVTSSIFCEVSPNFCKRVWQSELRCSETTSRQNQKFRAINKFSIPSVSLAQAFLGRGSFSATTFYFGGW
ncbi:hypothetical protein K1719_038502 [Acacia pycnantha]|nr:hypothetical protein K1719_038502 [Acacia pycnantha]